MKKSAIIIVSMLFSIAVPTLAESAANYTQPDAQPATIASQHNHDLAARSTSGPQDKPAVSNKAKPEDLRMIQSANISDKNKGDEISTSDDQE